MTCHVVLTESTYHFGRGRIFEDHIHTRQYFRANRGWFRRRCRRHLHTLSTDDGNNIFGWRQPGAFCTRRVNGVCLRGNPPRAKRWMMVSGCASRKSTHDTLMWVCVCQCMCVCIIIKWIRNQANLSTFRVDVLAWVSRSEEEKRVPPSFACACVALLPVRSRNPNEHKFVFDVMLGVGFLVW